MRKFVKPTGSPVYLPEQDRDILPEGESVEVTGYIERLIARGILKVADVAKKESEIKQGKQESRK